MAVQFHESRLRLARGGVLLLLAAAAASAYLTRHALAVANTTIQLELGLNNEQFGYLYAGFSLGYMLFQIPGGWVGQKLGSRLALPLFAVLWSVMTLATAVVTTLTALVIVRFLFGVAQAGLIPTQGKVLLDWVPDTSRGTASAVLVAAMSIGSIASLSLTSWLMQELPWRSIFVGYSFLGVVWAILFAIAFRSTPAEVRWIRMDDDSLTSETSARNETDAVNIPGQSPGRFIHQMLMSRNVWGLSVQALFRAAAYNLLVTFLPALLEYQWRTPRSEVGVLTSWSLGIYIAGSLLGGWLVDFVLQRTGSKFCSRSGVGAVTLALAGIFTLVAGHASTATGLSAWLALAGLFGGMAGAAPWAATMDISGRNTAIVMGFMNSSSALAGVLISPLVGRLIDFTKTTNGNWTLVYWLHAGFYLLAAGCWLAVNPDRSLQTSGVTHAV